MFTPLPPTRSGIADYSVELLTALGSRHQTQVYVVSPEEIAGWSGSAVPFAVRSAHDFVWMHQQQRHDLVVFQLGNSWCHDYMWPYVFRYPGLVVLHDTHLHHARAWSLLRRRRRADYRAELAFNHPALPPEAAEPALHGFGGPLYYAWPMLGTVMASARAVAVHNAHLAAELAAEFPGTPVDAIRMGVAERPASSDLVAALRARHALAPDAIVVAAFGAVSDEKRITPLLKAMAVARRYETRVRLLIVGQALPHHDAMAMAREAGLADVVTGTGYVPDDELGGYLAAADVVSCLRWPSARETSASWLRAISAGRATIVTDLAQQADVPTLDPRNWTLLDARPDQTVHRPIAVSIDVLDEDHSLTLALKRLTTDRALREQLGASAADYWRARHTLGHMVADYETVMQRATERTRPQSELPQHLRPDSVAHTRDILAPFGPSLPTPLA
jgi:glycosyltransferase involved in cell wall biosynthesis